MFSLFLLVFWRCGPYLRQRCGNRCSLLVRKLVHRLFGEPHAIGLARIVRRHPAAVPAEDRLELGDRRAVLGGARGCDLAHAVGGAWHTGNTTRFAEFVAEGFLRQWSAALAADE
jgi:hypothetical protein